MEHLAVFSIIVSKMTKVERKLAQHCETPPQGTQPHFCIKKLNIFKYLKDKLYCMIDQVWWGTVLGTVLECCLVEPKFELFRGRRDRDPDQVPK